MQEKLAKHEERARQVLERKKALGHSQSNEELHLSWGGEKKGLASSLDTSNASLTQDNSEEALKLGNGNGVNRLGSGKSTNSDATEVLSEYTPAAIDPLKRGLKSGFAGLAPRSRNAIA